MKFSYEYTGKMLVFVTAGVLVLSFVVLVALWRSGAIPGIDYPTEQPLIPQVVLYNCGSVAGRQ